MICTRSRYISNLSRLCVSNNKWYSVSVARNPDPEWEKAMPYNKIPGPSKFQLFRGFLPGGKYHNLDLISLCRTLQSQYGDVVHLPGIMGKKEMIFAFRPEMFEKVFRTEGMYPERRGLETSVYYRKEVRPDIFDGLGDLITNNGPEWYDARKKVNPVMLQPKTVRTYVEKVDQVACDFIDRIRKLRNEETNEMPDNFGNELNKWSMESIGVIALDERLGTLSDDLPEGRKIIESVKKFFTLSYELEVELSLWKYYTTPKLKELIDVFNFMTETVMRYVDKAVERLDAKEKNTDDSVKSVLEKLLEVDRKLAVVMALDMILAGVDTTSGALAGCLYNLSQNPDKQAKLREEVLKCLPEKSSKLTSEMLNRMPYLKACLKESLRIHPVAPANGRVTGDFVVIGGYQVPKGATVSMINVVLHHDPNYFTDAEKFIPERWLRENNDSSDKLNNPFVYLPFGFGPRSCIGRRFAELEVHVLVARIMQSFNVEYHYGPLKFSRKSVLLTPDDDLKFKFTELKQ